MLPNSIYFCGYCDTVTKKKTVQKYLVKGDPRVLFKLSEKNTRDSESSWGLLDFPFSSSSTGILFPFSWLHVGAVHMNEHENKRASS